MSILLRRSLFGWLLVGLIVTQVMGDDKTPQSRTSRFDSCASLFAQLAGDSTANEKLDDLNLSPSTISEGTVYLTKKGSVVARPFGAKAKKDILVIDDLENARTKIIELLVSPA